MLINSRNATPGLPNNRFAYHATFKVFSVYNVKSVAGTIEAAIRSRGAFEVESKPVSVPVLRLGRFFTCEGTMHTISSRNKEQKLID